MLNEIAGARGCLYLLFAVTAVAGCGDAAKYPAGGAGLERVSRTADEAVIFHVREDARRKRLWVLALNEVRVYDTTGLARRLIRTLALPQWSVVGFRYVCMPDMVLDKSGSAFISSNGQARLLRIDADSFDMTDYAINFHASAGRDNGFGALAFASDGTLLARTTVDGLLWKIDITTATAIMIDKQKKAPSDACSITTPFLNPSARSPQ